MPDEPPPRHLAVIPDGNRRWASERGLTPTDGHRAGIAQVGVIAHAALQAGVQVFSFWWGSPANLTQRAPTEVSGIVSVLETWLREVAPDLCHSLGARFEVIGRYRELCPSLEPAIQALPTEGEKAIVLFMAYDGREEIKEAARGSRDFETSLWTAHLPPVDLLIRTGGGAHFSAGFLLWLLAESQLSFPDPLWPAFTLKDFQAELARYATTERRFGR